VVAVRVVELALVHEGVVVDITDPAAGGTGALDDLIDCCSGKPHVAVRRLTAQS